MIQNPVLRGTHPDPSILRVGPDLYVATSTFEWSPGVRLHHSTDLVHWRPLGGVLDTPRLLDLTGCPDSGGVWAPNLSHVDGLFHLVYSNVSTYAGGFTDSPNYLVTAASPEGPWSDPVLLNARGFDASLFHDGDESWLLTLVHDWRPGHGGSAGLEATRYDRASQALVGAPVPIRLPGGDTWVEGPNLYRRGPWYYLVTADGGTGYDHQVSVSRSRSLAGPYVRDPAGPLLTSRDHPDLPLQKAGHGSLVETADGSWYLAYLVARPLGRHGPCLMGRETALAPVVWTDDGWPAVPTGLPAAEVPVEVGVAGAPADRAVPEPASGPQSPPVSAARWQTSDEGAVLGPCWSTLRRPATEDWVTSLGDPARLRVRGGRSPGSFTGPSLVARPLTENRCSFEATVEFRPRDFQQLAGITLYYNSRNWHFVHVTADADGVAMVRVASSDRGVLSLDEAGQEVLTGPQARLGLDLDGADLRFRLDDGSGWRGVGGVLDAAVVSDEHVAEYDGDRIRALGFTGAYLGLWVWDLSGSGLAAEFGDVVYET